MSRPALYLMLVTLISTANAQEAAIGIPSATGETASFVVWETGGQLSKPSGYAIGEMVADRAGDTIVVRYRYDRRSQEGGQRSETRYRISATGQVLSAESRPLNPDSAATGPTERFEIADAEGTWTRNGGGRAKVDGSSFYRLRQDTPFDDALLAKFLLGQPQQMGRLLPDGTTVRVEIVADTAVDYNTELELYEHAGIPAPRVLQIARIVAARVMGDDAHYGSITAGKVADILIVGGQPAERVADLRKHEHVIRRGPRLRPAGVARHRGLYRKVAGFPPAFYVMTVWNRLDRHSF